MYRTLVADRRMLIVLDDAVTSDQVRLLVPDSPRSLVLITSRDPLSALDNAHSMALDILSVDEAITLLRHIAGGDRVASGPQAALVLMTCAAT